MERVNVKKPAALSADDFDDDKLDDSASPDLNLDDTKKNEDGPYRKTTDA